MVGQDACWLSVKELISNLVNYFQYLFTKILLQKDTDLTQQKHKHSILLLQF